MASSPLQPCKITGLQMVNYYFPSCNDTPFSHALQKVQAYIWIFNYFLPPYVWQGGQLHPTIIVSSIGILYKIKAYNFFLGNMSVITFRRWGVHVWTTKKHPKPGCIHNLKNAQQEKKESLAIIYNFFTCWAKETKCAKPTHNWIIS